MSVMEKKQRNINLDILRGIAVTLVIFRHISLPERTNILYDTIHYLQKIGWVGVDLFFVLSGYLVSGLIVNELNKEGHFNIKRFLIRRALKIYPPFYLLILVTVTYNFFYKHKFVGLTPFLAECFYIQNYITGLWNHTWTLAVEEHFYLILPLLFFAFKPKEKSYYKLLIIICGIMALITILRIASSENIITNDRIIFYSHFRLDILFFGVFIRIVSYQYKNFLNKYQSLITLFLYICPIIVLIFISTVPLYSELNFTIGYLLIYVCFGAMLLSLTNTREKYNKIAFYSAKMGKYSYGIYLWHMPIKFWVVNAVSLFVPLGYVLQISIYIIASIVLGILFSKTIEFPILKLRDKYFPSSS